MVSGDKGPCISFGIHSFPQPLPPRNSMHEAPIITLLHRVKANAHLRRIEKRTDKTRKKGKKKNTRTLPSSRYNARYDCWPFTLLGRALVGLVLVAFLVISTSLAPISKARVPTRDARAYAARNCKATECAPT